MKDSYFEIVDGALASITLMPAEAFGWNTWMVSEVACQRRLRGKGYASKLFKQVIADADEEAATLVLTIEPDPPELGGLTYDQLEIWYRSLGFQWTEEGWMERKPNG